MEVVIKSGNKNILELFWKHYYFQKLILYGILFENMSDLLF